MALEFFDAQCAIGRPRIASRAHFLEPEDLLREMDRIGIARALVSHVVAAEHAPSVGNRMLAAAAAGRDRLVLLWTALPAATGEIPPPEAMLNEMAAVGARAVRLLPRTHSFSLDACDELYRSLAAARIPLFISVAECSLEAIGALCGRHPGLAVVATEVGYRSDRLLYPLLAAHENLHLTLSHYQVHDGLGTLADRFDAERMLFATGGPALPGGMALGQVLCARLAPEARQRVASGNLERLLAGSPTRAPAVAAARDMR